MTWHASHIYFEYRKELLGLLKQHPIFASGVHWVNELNDIRWPGAWAEHSLPPGGVIVVRELAGWNESLNEALEPDVLLWKQVEGETLTVVLTPQQVFGERPESEFLFYAPPRQLLGELKVLAKSAGAKVAYFQAETWAGSTETELAWVWSDTERVAVYSDEQSFAVGCENGSVCQKSGRVLNFVLAEMGIDLGGSNYFALHTREFPWKQY